MSRAIELVGPEGYIHGWIKADAEGHPIAIMSKWAGPAIPAPVGSFKPGDKVKVRYGDKLHDATVTKTGKTFDREGTPHAYHFLSGVDKGVATGAETAPITGEQFHGVMRAVAAHGYRPDAARIAVMNRLQAASVLSGGKPDPKLNRTTPYTDAEKRLVEEAQRRFRAESKAQAHANPAGRAITLAVKTPAPMRAAGRRALAAKGQALPGGQDPVPNLDSAKRPALAALIRKRAKALKATNAPGVKNTWAFQGSNDTEAIDLAMSGRLPLIRGAADVQMRRTGPSVVTVQHASTGAKVGTLIPAASGYQGVHADGTKTPASGSMGGAMAGLIAYHNRQAAARKLPPAQQDGTAVMAGGAKTYAGDQQALEFVGPKGFIHGWIHVGVEAHHSPSDKADIMSKNAFGRGDSTQAALEGHGEAAKAHRYAAKLSGTEQGNKYHTAMAGLHTKVARMRLESRDAEDRARKLGLANDAGGLDLAGALPTYTSASSSTDGPRITSMSAGKKPASVPPVKLKLADQGMGDAWKQIYRKLIAKGLKPAQAAAMAKRAAAMHAKAARAPKASAA
jgi:hypothetical protein